MRCRIPILFSAALLLGATACEPPWEQPVRRDIDAATAVGMIRARAGDPDFVILDVRTAAEFAVEHVRDAVNMDVTAPDFEPRLGALDRNDTHLVYCLAGGRGRRASEIMESKRFAETLNVLGGITAIRQTPGGAELIVPGE